MAYVRTVALEEATGSCEAQYKAALQRAGKVYEVVKLHSLMPDCMRASMQLYGAAVTAPTAPLPRWLREAIAVVVSRTNDCFY